ncbi:MAG: LPS export ABC transporter periplasmic protein LptC [Cyanobacteriota bacterium]|nr:LPS export ABC transporter periplasmic protein LptC [Cyanobacteriota bacterium]
MRQHAKRLGALGLLVAAVLAGCSSTSQNQQPNQGSTPFVFQALNLRQQDAQGQLLWRVNSPEARYDLNRRLALARNLSGEIHAKGQVLYRLQASHGTVINDGAVIQLEGVVRIERLGQDPVTITASRMRWYPPQQRIELDRGASAQDQDLRLTAAKATLLFDRDLLQLRGQPTLMARRAVAGAGLDQLKLQQLDWSPGSGRLMAPGPVQASSTASGQIRRELKASGLEGNTLSRTLTLKEPVRVSVPAQNAWLEARSSTIDLVSGQVRSGAPFTAAVGPLQIAGEALQLDLRASVAQIVAGCRLRQPDLSLSARRCSWNWQNEAIAATGSVVLRRQANQQTTRAAQLRGRIGPRGLLVFSAPGSRVQSTLVLPPAQPRRQQSPSAIRL